MEISFRSNSDDNFNMSDKEKKRGKKSGLGLAIWILAIVILIIVFLVKSEDIKTNLKKTRFFERLFGKTPTFLTEKNSEKKKDDKNSENVIDLDVLKKSDGKAESKKSQDELKTQEFKKNEQKSVSEKKAENKAEQKSNSKIESEKNQQIEKSKKSESKSEPKRENTNEKSETQKKNDASNQIKTVQENKVDTTAKNSGKDEKQKSEAKEKLTQSEKKETSALKTSQPATVAAKICFVAIDSDGPVIRKEVNRQVAKDSPLTESLNSLLTGPSAMESKTGCRTLIPAGTKLYSAVVKNGTATLNFSEEFEFNTYGVEGYLGQLMQIVYTATNFSTVQNVQILIEGEKKEYLGSEGVWIGSPLSRASFR